MSNAPKKIKVAVELDGRAVTVIQPGEGWKATWDGVDYVRLDEVDALRDQLRDLQIELAQVRSQASRDATLLGRVAVQRDEARREIDQLQKTIREQDGES
jgi:hypothetical protein